MRRFVPQRQEPKIGSRTIGQLPWSEEEVGRIRSGLLRFFEERSRSLPWRDDPDPYRILVSEVMSQQTRMETVVPYYQRWIRRFPDCATLAAADQEEVLALWEGLGYYSRARNLHQTARELEARYGGRVPADPEELETLPGVGPYTAGAVASMAFGVPTPAVDGNVRRVLSRLLDDPAPAPARLRRWATALVDPERPGDFNQALMELGSLVCTPRSPRCGRCPVASFCGARAAGTQEERPAPRRSREIPRRVEAVAVLRAEDTGSQVRFLLRRRPPEGLLGGMWEFPGVEVDAPETPESAAMGLAQQLVTRAAAPPPGRDDLPAPRPLPVVNHAFSHLKVTYRPFLFSGLFPGLFSGVASAGRGGEGSSGGGGDDADPQAGRLRWLEEAELQALPVPVAQRRIFRQVEAHLADRFPGRRGAPNARQDDP